MADTPMQDNERRTITLTLDDDKVIKCMVLTVLPVNNQKYIALLPLGDNGEPDPEAETYIYRFIDHGPDEDPELENIEDEKEFNDVADAFSALMQDES